MPNHPPLPAPPPMWDRELPGDPLLARAWRELRRLYPVETSRVTLRPRSFAADPEPRLRGAVKVDDPTTIHVNTDAAADDLTMDDVFGTMAHELEHTRQAAQNGSLHRLKVAMEMLTKDYANDRYELGAETARLAALHELAKRRR